MTQTSNSKSEFEVRARQAKATKMATVLVAHRATEAEVRALPAKGRRIVAELAGCHLPSDATWTVVAEIVRADAFFAGSAVA